MDSIQIVKCDSGKALFPVDVWQNSAVHLGIAAPDRYVRVVFHFSNTDYEYEDGFSTEAFFSPDLGIWRADVPETMFPTGGQILMKVSGYGTAGEVKTIGEGYCRVKTGFASANTNDSE